MWAPVSPWRVIPGSGQALAVGTTQVNSVAVGAQTRSVRLVTTANCLVAIGRSQTAGSSGIAILAGADPEVFAISPGDMVSVIQLGTSTGTLYMNELTH